MKTIGVLAPLFWLMLLWSFPTDPIELGLAKLDGAVITTFFTAPFLYYIVQVHGYQKSFLSYICASLIVLIFTLLYKYQFGFWDRNVRFFINGPIVFGWLMGASALMALELLRQKMTVFRICAFVAFALAIIWTQSKGPLVAFSIASLVLVASSLNLKLALFSALGAALVILLAPILLEGDFFSRFSAIGRLLSGVEDDTDLGSIQVRRQMIAATLQLINENPIFGVGLGGWMVNIFELGELFEYPHNIFLEITSECGFFGLLVLILTLFYCFKKTSQFGKVLLLFFMIASSFSGDLSYLRLALTFSIGLFGMQVNPSLQTRQLKGNSQ